MSLWLNKQKSSIDSDLGLAPDSNPQEQRGENALEIAEQIKAVLLSEADAIRELAQRIDPTITSAIELLINCQGRVIVSGTVSYTHLTLPTKRIV